LTSQKSGLAGKTHAQDTPSHFSKPAARPETPLKYTLNALSLFHKLVQLFSSPSTSLSSQTKPNPSPRVDPSQSIISLSSDNEPFPYEKTFTTATFNTKTSPVPAKTCPQTNKPENPLEILNNLYLTQKTSLHPIPRPQPSQILNSYLEKDRTPLLWNQTQKRTWFCQRD
jgi:hypothetical protein